jgi:hypothetical protein
VLVMYALQFGPVATVLTYLFALVANLLMVLGCREYEKIRFGTDQEGNENG